MTTTARTFESASAHWYEPKSGMPMHEVANKTKGGMRPTTLRDARELSLLPSVTTILKVLNKPGLNEWKSEQVALSILTTPRNADEDDDAFVKRVLHDEEHQNQEARTAADIGKGIHRAIQQMYSGKTPQQYEEFARPVFDGLDTGFRQESECVLIGNGFAGTADLISEDGCEKWIYDFKTCKELPQKQYPEHRLQLSAYAAAYDTSLRRTGIVKRINAINVYISRTNPGEYKSIISENWYEDFKDGFEPALKLWQWMNSYTP